MMSRPIGTYAAVLAGILLLGLVTMAVPVAGIAPRQPNSTELASTAFAGMTANAVEGTQAAIIKATANAPGGPGPVPVGGQITTANAASLIEVARYDRDWYGSASWSATGRYFVESGLRVGILLYDLQTGMVGAEVVSGTGYLSSVAVSDDGVLVAASGNNLVGVWDVATGERLATLEEQWEPGLDMDFSPDGTLLAVSFDDGSVAVYDLVTYARLFLETTNAPYAYSVEFSPDGTYVVTGGTRFGVELWDARTGDLLGTLPAVSNNIVTGLAFTPDGSLLATGDAAYDIWLYDMVARETIGMLEGHDEWVNAVAFSPDGTLLASASDDLTVRVWDVATRTELVVLRGHTESVRRVTFSPDGTLVLSAGRDERLIVWGLPR